MNKSISEAEWHLLNALDELKRQSTETDEYQNLMAAKTLRFLLLDGSPLLHQANRLHKVKIEFVVGDNSSVDSADPSILFTFMGIGISPRLGHPQKKQPHKLTLENFLSYRIGRYQEHVHTVRDVIDVAANKFGGVHLSSPRSLLEKEVALKDFSVIAAQTMGGFTPLTLCTQALRGIGAVVIDATDQLRQSVLGTATASAPPSPPTSL